MRTLFLGTTLSLAVAAALPLAANAADGEPRFLDRDLLIETLTLDEQEPLAEAEAELEAAEAELATAEKDLDDAATAVATATNDLRDANQALMDAEDALALDPTNPDLPAAVDMAMKEVMDAQKALEDANADFEKKQDIVTEKQGIVTEKAAVVQAILDEIALTGELVRQLSDKQVQALNAAFHSSYQTGLLPYDFDSDLVQRILDENLGTGSIHHLVTAFRQEALFLKLAARFDAKAIESGEEKFASHAERAREKGATEFDKFMDKVDAASARAEAKEVAREERRAAVRGNALGHQK